MTQLQHILIATLITLFGGLWHLDSEKHSKEDLYQVLKAKDSLLFDRAFNHCETQHLESLIAEDFEFYHDQSGIQDSKAVFIAAMQNGICNPENTTKSRRELVPGSLKVFPLKANGEVYGALQNGTHRFFETTDGQEVAGSIAEFSHLWLLIDQQWVLKRVISYDHRSQVNEHSNKVYMSISEDLLDSYIGHYQAKDTGLVIISRTEKGLHINAGGMNTDIHPTSPTLFEHHNRQLTFEFISNDAGTVEKFIVRENNQIVEEAIKL